MSNVIDLSDPKSCPEALSFDHGSDKTTATGMTFVSYNGLRMYLITGKKHNYFLRTAGQYIPQFEHHSVKYEYVPDLYDQLEEALRINLAKNPLIKLKVNKRTEFVWTQIGITPAEEEWVKIVRKVAAKM